MTTRTVHDAAELLGLHHPTAHPAGQALALVPAAPADRTQALAPAGGTDLAALLGVTDLAQVHTGVPQAQGDVLVLPWPPHVAPTVREHTARATGPVPACGWVVVRGRQGHSHTVLADGPGVRAGHDQHGDGLAVVVVEPGSAAVLAHEVHADLHIGAGVYVLRRQRRHTTADPASSTAYVED